MQRVSLLISALILSVLLSVSGCSSAQKKLSEDVKGIKTRVDTLETRVEGVEAKQTEAERMTMEQAQRVDEMKAQGSSQPVSTNVGIKNKNSPEAKERVREIQACLKNAGFYKGEVDGVKGRKTKSAIKKFQKENGLTADGVVGKKTWEVLSKYSSGGAPAISPVEGEATIK